MVTERRKVGIAWDSQLKITDIPVDGWAECGPPGYEDLNFSWKRKGRWEAHVVRRDFVVDISWSKMDVISGRPIQSEEELDFFRTSAWIL